MKLRPHFAILAASLLLAASARGEDVASLTASVRAVEPRGHRHAPAISAAKSLAKLDGTHLIAVLEGMDGAGPLATNWLRSVVEVIVDREKAAGRKLPLTELEKFMFDRSHSPRPRRLAYELITAEDEAAGASLIPKFIDDPSVELRREAVAQLLTEAEKALKTDRPAAERLYRQALTAARDDDQVRLAADQLKTLGQPVDLARHFGFITRWKLVGPFDNTDKKGYPVAYPPEKELKLDATYDGKTGKVGWIDHTTADEYGRVDVNKALGKSMGAAAYAVATFRSPSDLATEVRAGSSNAIKVWVNGALVYGVEIYHANVSMDQYIGSIRLRPGENTLLVKVLQNEQKDEWAQDWMFQLRICDATGTPIQEAPGTASVGPSAVDRDLVARQANGGER